MQSIGAPRKKEKEKSDGQHKHRCLSKMMNANMQILGFANGVAAAVVDGANDDDGGGACASLVWII